MRVQLTPPTTADLAEHLAKQHKVAHNYTEIGATQATFPEHYYCHRNRYYLGQGEACWAAAKQALDQWEQFAPGWARVYPKEKPKPGLSVVVWFNIFGLWWKNSARVVYTRDEDNHYGFAYGTLPDHIAKGEEYFGVERDADGNCHFVLEAFCQPVFWGVRLFESLMRREQRRFVEDAGKQMQAFTAKMV